MNVYVTQEINDVRGYVGKKRKVYGRLSAAKALASRTRIYQDTELRVYITIWNSGLKLVSIKTIDGKWIDMTGDDE